MEQLDGPINVLHVDDEPDFADMTATFLERQDDRLDVTPETHGEAALNRISNAEIDCIVCDYQMP